MKSDGTLTGTKMVKDINPGDGGSYPYSLFSFKKNIYFGAFDGTGNNYSFWKTDGTKKGTIKLKDIIPAFANDLISINSLFCVAGDNLFFSAFDYNAFPYIEGELYKSNGTVKGTKLVKDINPYYGSYPYNLTNVDGTLFFFADDGTHGSELWKSNGKAKNTLLVKDASFYGSSYSNLCSAGGKVYFLNYNSYPNILWTSDGTAANTKLVEDGGLKELLDIYNLTGSGDKLFFGGITNQYGTELYSGDVCDKENAPAKLISTVIKPETSIALFDAALFPNPAYGNTSLQLTGDVKNITVSINDITGKSIWKKGYKDQHTINLPAGKMSAGIYLVTVRNANESKTLRFIKE